MAVLYFIMEYFGAAIQIKTKTTGISQEPSTKREVINLHQKIPLRCQAFWFADI